MSKKELFVLFENGSDGKDVESCIIAITTNYDIAVNWVDKDQQYRDVKKLELNQIPCAECEGLWHIPEEKDCE